MVFGIGVVALAGQAPKKWTAPRTPDGQPDLQGYWTNSTYVPLERPDKVTKAFYTEQALKDVIADRLGGKLAMRGLLSRAFCLPGLWSLARRTLSWVDRRPGRLYSFVCTRP